MQFYDNTKVCFVFTQELFTAVTQSYFGLFRVHFLPHFARTNQLKYESKLKAIAIGFIKQVN